MSHDVTDIEDKTFVLGVERSGTTWLGNIFASSPAVDYYPEPFAPRTFICEHFPGRLSYLSESNASLTEYLVQEFRSLAGFKYRNGERFGSSPATRKWVHLRKRLNEEVSRRSGLGPSLSLLRWQHLNLHRHDNPEVLDFQKDSSPSNLVVKDVRLNFQVAALLDAFVDARFVVVVRNPYSQVNSMLTWIRRGSLQELRGTLSCLFETVANHRRFSFAKSAIETLWEQSSRQLLVRCVAYWFMNYTILLEDLESMGASLTIVRHEDLCEEPFAQTRELMDFASLSLGEQTRDYLASTTRADNAVRSPLDTRRHSRSHYKEALARIPEERLAQLKTACEALWPTAHEQLREYEDWLHDHLPSSESSPEFPR